MADTGSTGQALDTTFPRQYVSARTQAEQVLWRSYELSSITLEEYAAKMVAASKLVGEVDRRVSTDRRVKMLRDEWAPLLKAYFINWVTDAVRKAVLGKADDHMDISRNAFKHITRELSVAYKSPALRSTPKSPKDGERYNELLKGTGFDLFWQQVERHVEACNDVLIWPDVVTIDGKKQIRHRWCVGNRATVITLDEEPTIPEGVLFIDQFRTMEGDVRVLYNLWTDRWHAQFAEGADGLEQTGYVDPDIPPAKDGGSANPYGVLPFIPIHKNRWQDTFWDITTGEDLVDLTLNVGVAKLFYNYMRKMSGFKQLIAWGDSVDRTPQMLLDPAAVAKIVTSGGIEIADWTIDLGAYLECMEREELAKAAALGINPERYKQKQSHQNAHAAALSERGLAEIRMHKMLALQDAEQRYYRMCCIVWAAMSIEDVPDKDAELEVIHAPIWYPSDPKAQSELDSADISRGLESPVTIWMKRHPGATEEEAEAAIKKNMEQTAKVQAMKVTHNMPKNPETESLSAEENGGQGGRPIEDADGVNMQSPPGAAPGKPNPPEE